MRANPFLTNTPDNDACYKLTRIEQRTINRSIIDSMLGQFVYFTLHVCISCSVDENSQTVKALILSDTEVFDNQFAFRETRGTAFACNLLNDITSYFKAQNSPVFVAALDAEHIFYSICPVSLFLKLIHVLPVYNWKNKLNAVVKWNDSYCKYFV